MELREQRQKILELDRNFMTGGGEGPPIVFLHGVLRRWQDFWPVIPDLGSRYKLYAADHRGHGRSSWGKRYLVQDYVEDAVAFVKKVVGRPCILFGHSLGALVAAGVAAAAPEFVHAAILEDPPFFILGASVVSTPLANYYEALQKLAGEHRTTRELALAMSDLTMQVPGQERPVRLGDVRDAAQMRFAAACLLQVDPYVFNPIIGGEWLDGYDRAEVLRRIRCPSLVLMGEPASGGMLSPSELDDLKGDFTDLIVKPFPGAGHLLHWSHTGEVMRTIWAFLESLEAPPETPLAPTPAGNVGNLADDGD